MKKLILILTISTVLFGCSSLELEAVSSSEEETQRILSLELSHKDNLIEANKLKSDHMISVVTLQLINARDEKIQAQINLIESEKIAEEVIISDSGMRFTGPEIVDRVSNILSTKPLIQNYYLQGLKSSSIKNIAHTLNVTLSYSSKKRRDYSTANICDEWGRCDTPFPEIRNLSSNFVNCTTLGCDYIEVVELDMSDEFLRGSLKKGITINLISKSDDNKIKLSTAYLMGYLKVAK
jgi:hypothetical protein